MLAQKPIKRLYIKDSKRPANWIKTPEIGLSKISSKGLKKNCQKLGLFKINEDDTYKEYDNSEDDNKELIKLQPNKIQHEKALNKIEEYSSREKLLGSDKNSLSKIDPLRRGKLKNYNAPRGRDLLFSYNTQYGGGFMNYKNTKIGQYQQAYNKIDEQMSQKKKQTASSLQRFENSHQFGKIPNYNVKHGNIISNNISKNEFSSSIYDNENTDTCMGKKKSSAMEVMEFAKIFKNKGEEKGNYDNAFGTDMNNHRAKNPCPPLTGNNLEYRDLKNFNWIKGQMNNDHKPQQKPERPWTRGGEKRGLDFSFIEQDNRNDLVEEGSYFDRPVTRSKPRRPVSRQVRLNKRVNYIRGGRSDSESFRGNDELGEWDPPNMKIVADVYKIPKVIPDMRIKQIQDSVSPIKTVNKDSFLGRKFSNESNKNRSSNKSFIASELNRSIESIKLKNKNSPPGEKNKKQSLFQNGGNLYWIQEEKETNGKFTKENYESFVSNTQDTKDTQGAKNYLGNIKTKDSPDGRFNSNITNLAQKSLYLNDGKKNEEALRSRKKKLKRQDDLLQMNRPQLDEFISRKMKRTDGFMSFKPSIGGANSSNSLFPSSSGDTIISDLTHQITSSTSDKVNIQKWIRNQVKEQKKQTQEMKSKYKSRNKNNVGSSKNTETGMIIGSQNSSTFYSFV